MFCLTYFKPTLGYMVCSTHFNGGKKTNLNKFPTITPKKKKAPKARATSRARNQPSVREDSLHCRNGDIQHSSNDVCNEELIVDDFPTQINSEGEEDAMKEISKLRIDRFNLCKEYKLLINRNEDQLLSQKLVESSNRLWFSVGNK